MFFGLPQDTWRSMVTIGIDLPLMYLNSNAVMQFAVRL